VGVEKVPVVRKLGVVAAALAVAFGLVVWSGSAAQSSEDDSTDTTEAQPYALPPVDPSTVSAARVAGEAAAAEVRRSVFAAAEQRREIARSGSQEAVSELSALTDALAVSAANTRTAGDEIDRIQFVHRELVEDRREAASSYQRRVAELYVDGPMRIVDDLMDGYGLVVARTRQILLDAVLVAEQRRVVETYVAATSDVIDVAALSDALGEDRATRMRLIETYSAVATSAEQRAMELADAEQLTDDLAFPVARDYSFVDTFLAPRSVGTPDVHRHQGIDIFAPQDTPLVAVERGIVVRVGEVRLGGFRVWLIGESGAQYYYAHMSAHADITEGQFVETGTVLGYVGTSGNARGTSPHVHFQFHPDGGAAVNAFPLLDQLRSRDKELVDSGMTPYGLCKTPNCLTEREA